MANSFALAMYDNDAESEDELTFKKNDILQILQSDYMSMEGWCLCKLVRSSRVGLAAGNRLKVISDEKILAKLNKSYPIKFSSKTNSIISTSSSNSSITSSSNSLYSSISTMSYNNVSV